MQLFVGSEFWNIRSKGARFVTKVYFAAEMLHSVTYHKPLYPMYKIIAGDLIKCFLGYFNTWCLTFYQHYLFSGMIKQKNIGAFL